MDGLRAKSLRKLKASFGRVHIQRLQADEVQITLRGDGVGWAGQEFKQTELGMFQCDGDILNVDIFIVKRWRLPVFAKNRVAIELR